MSILLYLILLIYHVKSLYIPESNLAINNQNASEIQHAVCNIATKEVNASANATITRELRGVCTSNQLTSLLNQLEEKIFKELKEIKLLLNPSAYKTAIKPNDAEYEYDNENDSKEVKSLSARSISEEIEKYNDSISLDDVYTYYWKIEDIKHVANKMNMYISSPGFEILGHSLEIQFYPHHLNTENIGILLRPSSRSFIKQHKFSVVDQFNFDDLSSEILGKLSVDVKMFIVPPEILNEAKYTHKNCLIIKVDIYLNS